MRLNTRSFLLVFCLFFGLLTTQRIFAQQYHGDSWATAKANGQGNLAVVYYQIPGMIEANADGSMSGVCVDLLQSFADYVDSRYRVKLKIDYQGQERAFNQFLDASNTGNQVLGVSTVSITPERQETMNFTPPFMNNMLVMLTHHAVPSLDSWENIPKYLEGRKALAIAGGNNVAYLEYIRENYYPDMKIELRASEKVILSEMSNNADYFTILDFTDYYDAVKRRLPLRRQNLDLSDHFQESFGFILSQDSDWGPIWEAFLTADFRNGMAYKKIITDNLGGSFVSLVKQ